MGKAQVLGGHCWETTGGCKAAQTEWRFMHQQWVGAVRDGGEKYAEPKIYTCAAEEADDILELLHKVWNMGVFLFILPAVSALLPTSFI
jgi:hypothetical protein